MDRCRCCRRKLKNPDSIARGTGPICAAKDSGELSKDFGQLELDFGEPKAMVEVPVVAIEKRQPPERYRGLSMIDQHREACRVIDRWRYSADDCEVDVVNDG